MNMGPIGQIGSHLGNTGPFWQIRVPLDRLGSHWGFCGSPLIRLRPPCGNHGSHPENGHGDICRRGNKV